MATASFADSIAKSCRAQWQVKSLHRLLPHVAHLFLLGSFLEDGVRVALQFEDQYRYLAVTWTGGIEWSPMGGVLVAIVALGQLIPSLLILLTNRRGVAVLASFALLSMVLFRTGIYQVHVHPHFLAVNVAICGGLLLLLAEEKQLLAHPHPLSSTKSTNGSTPLQANFIPTQKERRTRSGLLLMGRILLLFMFGSMLISREEWDKDWGHGAIRSWRVVELTAASILMVLVVVGYKVRWSVLALSGWLVTMNFVVNAWWRLPVHHPYREFAKYDFFQTLSVVGGFLLVYHQGPGELSLDERNKKEW